MIQKLFLLGWVGLVFGLRLGVVGVVGVVGVPSSSILEGVSSNISVAFNLLTCISCNESASKV